MTDILDAKLVREGLASGILRDASPIAKHQLTLDFEITADAFTMAMNMDDGGRWLLLRAIENAQKSFTPRAKSGRALMKLNATSYATTFNRGRFTFSCDARSDNADPVFKVQYRSSGKKFVLRNDFLAYSGIPRRITADDILHLPVPAQWSANSGDDRLVIDPIVERMLHDLSAADRIRICSAAFALKAEIKLVEHTPGIETKPWIGIATRKTKAECWVCPAGFLKQPLYFQNGWLMLKLDKFPDRFGSHLVKGAKAESIISFNIPAGAGAVDVFEGLEIDRIQRGSTWMGPHAMLRFAQR